MHLACYAKENYSVINVDVILWFVGKEGWYDNLQYRIVHLTHFVFIWKRILLGLAAEYFHNY